ncbi:MAG TPA: hypothetical protein VH593_33035 [Ktedonobacteraceae bacterium]|jgi:Flp pilus assembly protein TadD
MQLSRFQEALTLCTQAIAIGPRESLFYTLQGVILFQLDHSQEAFLAYSQAIRLDYRNSIAYLNRSAALIKLDRPQDAPFASILATVSPIRTRPLHSL